MAAIVLTWPLDQLQAMLGHAFMRNAFLASTPIAAAAGLVGYFVVLRNQVFVSDVISHVAFSGALAAYAFAVDPLIGLFGASIVFGVIIGSLGERARGQDVATGTVFAWVLGLGVLFLSIYTTAHSATTGNVGIKVLFGSIFGVDSRNVLIATSIGISILVATLVIARPLLFASIDPEVAFARGIPVRALGLIFVALVGMVVAEAVQVVGSLLIVGLMVTPAAAAVRLSSRPFVALLLSAALAVGSVWLGLTTSYFAQRLPPSFVIITLAFAAYLAAVLFKSPPWRSRAAS
jgi:zinc/manganese transport system permease protein